MAGKSRPMSQIKQLIRLHTQGYSIKAIARTLSISRNTVKSYLQKLHSAALDPQELLGPEDPVLGIRPTHTGQLPGVPADGRLCRLRKVCPEQKRNPSGLLGTCKKRVRARLG